MAKTIHLKAFRAVSNGALSAPELPKALKILDWGESEANDGTKVALDDISVGIFAANQKRIGRGQVPIDFNHNTVPGTEAYKTSQEPRPIAGYGTPVIKPKEGLFLENITWTPAGEQHARNYIDLSPAPLIKNDRVIGLHSCALTPAGAIEGLSFYSAFDNFDALVAALETEKVTGEATAQSAQKTQTKDKPMPEIDPVLKALGADSVEAALKKIEELSKKPEPKAPEVKALSAEEVTKLVSSAVAEAVKPLSAELTNIKSETTSKVEQAEKDSLIQQAGKDGKVIPLSADEIKDVPVKVLKGMIEKLPKSQVPTKRSIRPLNADGKPIELKGEDLAAAAINEHIVAKYGEREAFRK